MNAKTVQLRLRSIPFCVCAIAASLVSGCAGVQSALDPAGPQAERISRLWWLMFWVCLVVFAAVIVALGYALRRGRRREAPDNSPEAESRTTKLIVGSLAVTVIILFLFMIADFSTGRALGSLQSSNAIVIKVTGRQWWWDFEYQDATPSQNVRVANEIHIPTGHPIKFEMTSQDVIHSFWAPNLHGKTDLLTGYRTVTWLQADRPGAYRGQCAEYCGHQHAHMAFTVVAEPPDKFNAWLDNQRRPAPQPSTAEQQAGERLFLTRACVMCHQIRGTDAGATTGPDLTHLATRRTIAAGTLANNRGSLGAWVVDSQRIKPGNKMPPNELSGEELNALLSYLESLK
jgi:cytochrome c oxidase subunit II